MHKYLIVTALNLVFLSQSDAGDESRVKGLRNRFEKLNQDLSNPPAYAESSSVSSHARSRTKDMDSNVSKIIRKFEELNEESKPKHSKSTRTHDEKSESFLVDEHEDNNDSHLAPTAVDENEKQMLQSDKGKEEGDDGSAQDSADTTENEDDEENEENLGASTSNAPSPKSPLLSSSSDFPPLLSQGSMAKIRAQGPSTVEESVKPVKIKKLLKLKGISEGDREAHRLRVEAARQRGAYPVAQIPVMQYFEFLKIPELHDMGLDGKYVKVGVIDSWFDYDAKNLKEVITQSTRDLAPVKGTGAYVGNKTRFNVGFDVAKGEFAVTGHHGNHVTSIINTIAPKSPIKYINFQAEQGIEGKDIPHYCAAIERAIESGVDFINFSLVFPGHKLNGPMADEIRESLVKAAQHGIGLIIALGNDYQSSAENDYVRDLIELSQSPEMGGRLILVGATKYKGGKERKAKFSNYPEEIWEAKKVIFAPGHSIQAQGGKGYDVVKSGTSQATPIVTGVASLVKEYLIKLELKELFGEKKKYSLNEIAAARSRVLPEEVFSILLRSARTQTFTESMYLDTKFGRGILNPTGAILYARKYHPRMLRQGQQLRPWAKRYQEIRQYHEAMSSQVKPDSQSTPSPEEDAKLRPWAKKYMAIKSSPRPIHHSRSSDDDKKEPEPEKKVRISDTENEGK